MDKYRVGIVGATGMVGQRFIMLLQHHPWFDICVLAASSRSAGKSYETAMQDRWAASDPIPGNIKHQIVLDAADTESVSAKCDFIFCAVDMGKQETRAMEEAYAKMETPVVSTNGACRFLPDIPMIIPEINPYHAQVIPTQRKRLGTQQGFIVVKPNCSIQSFVPALTPLRGYGIQSISVCTYQAISGAGKTFASWPEMVDNVIPYIAGEDEKSQEEPLKIWGTIEGGIIQHASAPVISAQCLRIAASDGHMAAVSVKFNHKPEHSEILHIWESYKPLPVELGLPNAPDPFLYYFNDPSRPQTRLDRGYKDGYGVTIGRLREDALFDYKFICLSHNTVRGAAGGSILTAELLCRQEYIIRKTDK